MWTPGALREVTAIRERNKFPQQHYGVPPRKRLKDMTAYTLRLEEEILELKGICKYMEGLFECEAPPIPKVTQKPKSAS